MQTDEELKGYDKEISEKILNLMETYQIMRDTESNFKFKNTRQWFVENWSYIKKGIAEKNTTPKFIENADKMSNILDLTLRSSNLTPMGVKSKFITKGNKHERVLFDFGSVFGGDDSKSDSTSDSTSTSTSDSTIADTFSGILDGKDPKQAASDSQTKGAINSLMSGDINGAITKGAMASALSGDSGDISSMIGKELSGGNNDVTSQLGKILGSGDSESSISDKFGSLLSGASENQKEDVFAGLFKAEKTGDVGNSLTDSLKGLLGGDSPIL